MRQRYPTDIDLLQFYGRKLIQRGWAGEMDAVERAYRRSHAPGAETRSRIAKERGLGTTLRG